MSEDREIPFGIGDWVADSADPSRLGQFTGRSYAAGPHVMVELRYPDGTTKSRPLSALEPRGGARGRTIDELLEEGRYGRQRDLQRVLTFEKLKGRLHDFIYSMEAAEVDFYPYQFKPVLKFVDSPTERLVIADEVGLGKTIESMLVWLELTARRQAKRLLIVCPKILTDKWRMEMRTKFRVEAIVADHQQIAQALDDLDQSGPGVACALIATYSGLRPPKSEVSALDHEVDSEERVSNKTKLLQRLRHWSSDVDPFDLVVFDEAHYMRNAGTATFRVGEALAASAGAVLCVSATPINNRNVDLHTLLRLIDPDFFQTQGTFEALLASNRPTVQAGNALAKIPVDVVGFVTALGEMKDSAYIGQSPLLDEVVNLIEGVSAGQRRAIARAQALLEKLNLLGGYVTRTRRVQVKEGRALREPLTLTVDYVPGERLLYDAIVDMVRRQCQADGRTFHVLQVLGLQLRAASCLPALAKEVRAGRFGDPEELLCEAFGDEEEDPDEAIDPDAAPVVISPSELKNLLDFDFERNDSKYAKLRDLLLNQLPDEKVVIFSFYRASLAYLARRLSEDGVPVAVIHGNVPNEERLEEINRVRESPGRMVLLSSEVGSEGLDLQFCRVVVNYDLPWNPMRVEQRIGRIDRVGQLAKRLTVVNFKIRNTVEERLFDKLHAKLLMFSNSLGDLEKVIGREVRDLTIQLLSRDLSPGEEARLVDQAAQVIEQNLIQVQSLEESGDALLALSDYLQRQLEEDRERGRFVRPDELEDYARDFFERQYQGSELAFGHPAAGCVTCRLSPEATQDLTRFVGDDRSLAAQPYRRREFSVTFRREVAMGLPPAVRRQVAFANHLSPLVRWITSRHAERPDALHRVSAVRLDASAVAAGAYVFRIERWQFKGLSKREQLAYSVVGLGQEAPLDIDAAEILVQQILSDGRSWDYPDCDLALLAHANEVLQRALRRDFGEAATSFDNENTTGFQIRSQRVKSVFERRLAQDHRRLQTAKDLGRSQKVIHLMESRIRAAVDARDRKLADLDQKTRVDFESSPVALGVLLVGGDV